MTRRKKIGRPRLGARPLTQRQRDSQQRQRYKKAGLVVVSVWIPAELQARARAAADAAGINYRAFVEAALEEYLAAARR